jgi:hypothetical protein
MDTAIIGKNVLLYAVGYISLCYAAGASSQASPVSLFREYTGKIQSQGGLFLTSVGLLLKQIYTEKNYGNVTEFWFWFISRTVIF